MLTDKVDVPSIFERREDPTLIPFSSGISNEILLLFLSHVPDLASPRGCVG
ncbi:hypothetical protein Q8W36_11615 [Alteromonas stellipolaris]|nr:hypothetical protein [Alteromonas stellipolaris]